MLCEALNRPASTVVAECTTVAAIKRRTMGFTLAESGRVLAEL